jgi:hypothetical protein
VTRLKSCLPQSLHAIHHQREIETVCLHT